MYGLALPRSYPMNTPPRRNVSSRKKLLVWPGTVVKPFLTGTATKGVYHVGRNCYVGNELHYRKK